MTRSLMACQAELPRSLPLFRYAPQRVRFDWQNWDPSLVRSHEDLPQYLILGEIDPEFFERSAAGWSARWQGTEADSRFEVSYLADTRHWEVRQSWCGLDGGFSHYSTRMPLEKVISQALYMQFPRNWEEEAKSRLESKYQLKFVEQQENAYTFCGIPDGTFLTVMFPISVQNLRLVRQWLTEVVEHRPPSYPFSVEAKLVFQAINYLEGKAPDWTAQEAVLFNHSVTETGLAPHGLPVREAAADGSAAWTLRREIYYLFIGLPFAGLTEFLDRMATENGPIRTHSAPELRFELRPTIVPAAFELQTESVAFMDQKRTTRSFLRFAADGEEAAVPSAEQAIEAERSAPETLAKIEEISNEVVTAVEQLFQRVMNGAAK